MRRDEQARIILDALACDSYIEFYNFTSRHISHDLTFDKQRDIPG